MSETEDIYKQTQAAELQQRRKDQFRKHQAELVRDAQWRQNSCSHFHRGSFGGTPLFDVVHNFPDERPRGLCHGCGALIQPDHWEPAEPGKMRFVAAHPLYPVVEALERADIGRTILQNVETHAVDHCLCGGSRAPLWDLESIFKRVHQEIDAQLQSDITPWMVAATEKK